MIQKEHLENFLRINGVSCDAPHEEIRECLTCAKWHHQDIEAALLVLRQEVMYDPVAEGNHVLMNTDTKPERNVIRMLLGLGA